MGGGPEGILKRGHLTNHVLLLEDRNQLILVDTGLGLRDVQAPHSRLSDFFLRLLKPDFREEMTAIRQIQKMGFDPRDVRHIILTHLDFDHAGGIDDFPWAQIHLLKIEYDSARSQSTWLDRQRFRPQQWGTEKNWTLYDATQGERWFGFEKVQGLETISPEIALVPLVGHTWGHCGVAIQKSERWIFNAGDAYFYKGEMNDENPLCTPGLRLYQKMMDKDTELREWNQARLRNLLHHHSHQVEVFCSHDLQEFEKLAGRSAEVPAEQLIPYRSEFQFDEAGTYVSPQSYRRSDSIARDDWPRTNR